MPDDRFMQLVAEVRPELHRYCARMTGSVADGEDVVQDALAAAYSALAEMEATPNLRPWLFAIAHRRAIDHLRRYERKYGQTLDDEMADSDANAEDELAAREAAALAVSRFCELPAAQRSVVVLKDVLGHSLAEIASELGLGLAAVKSALHRGRTRLRELGPAPGAVAAPRSAAVAKYIERFNARDWDGVRALLADDVQLDLVARTKLKGLAEVSTYYGRYDSMHDWHLVPGTLEGREAILVYESAAATKPRYFMQLTTGEDGRVVAIKDFRYVTYITNEAEYSR